MKEPDWDLYRSFLFVLKQGSLSAAARELGLSQPTVGRHVEALEATLRCQLFSRSQQGLIPTEAALLLRPFAETIAATSAAFLRAAGADREMVAGTVRISASEIVGTAVLPPILSRLQHEHPGLYIELSTTDLVEDILNREADIAIRMTEPTQAALLVRRVGVILLGFHAHRSYIDRYGMPAELSDLNRHRMIGYDRETAYIRAMSKRFPVLDGIRISFRADSNLAQLAAIRAGAGIGICQIGLVQDDPDIVRIMPESFELPLGVWVAMHEDLKSSPRCRVAFDALVAGLLDYVAGVGLHRPSS